ncbi:hypothetical protein BDV98DRAFT_297350 [Pterulicium gracile]|uniref:Secreted protein n=1 Tax=Pterulicium gracile TaxID=1884261 RepID=A0A5C3Q6X2_9AGAR|nr:hypothetical protein BDV98DRAFT_297350 [Pterula gracilis]
MMKSLLPWSLLTGGLVQQCAPSVVVYAKTCRGVAFDKVFVRLGNADGGYGWSSSWDASLKCLMLITHVSSFYRWHSLP